MANVKDYFVSKNFETNIETGGFSSFADFASTLQLNYAKNFNCLNSGEMNLTAIKEPIRFCYFKLEYATEFSKQQLLRIDLNKELFGEVAKDWDNLEFKRILRMDSDKRRQFFNQTIGHSESDFYSTAIDYFS